jgi:hypothetical protein
MNIDPAGTGPPRPGICSIQSWAIVPRRSPRNSQWSAHGIYGWRGSYSELSVDRSFCYRHYREINDHWKFDRSQREKSDPQRFVYDKQMAANFARVRWFA